MIHLILSRCTISHNLADDRWNLSVVIRPYLLGVGLLEQNQCDRDLRNQNSRSVNVTPYIWKTASMINKDYQD